MADKKTEKADTGHEDEAQVDVPVQGRESLTEPVVAPDGHTVLSAEDIKARDSAGA